MKITLGMLGGLMLVWTGACSEVYEPPNQGTPRGADGAAAVQEDSDDGGSDGGGDLMPCSSSACSDGGDSAREGGMLDIADATAAELRDAAPVGSLSDDFPPGCRDGQPLNKAWIADRRTFVISNAEQACGAPASTATRVPGDCAFPLEYVTYRVPSLRVAGTYQVGRDASIVIERRFPVNIDASGCTCLPNIDTPEALTSGTITIEPLGDGRIGAEIRMGETRRGILIEPCNGR